jgi:hypothetical protein
MDGIRMAIKYEIMFLEIRGSVHGRKHFPSSVITAFLGILYCYTQFPACVLAHKFLKNYQRYAMRVVRFMCITKLSFRTSVIQYHYIIISIVILL